jgi:hypothetical protein
VSRTAIIERQVFAALAIHEPGGQFLSQKDLQPHGFAFEFSRQFSRNAENGFRLAISSKIEPLTERQDYRRHRFRDFVENSASQGELRYSANIKPDVQVDLAFKVSGYAEYDAAYSSYSAAQARYDQAAQSLEDYSLLAPAVFGVPDIMVGQMKMGDRLGVTTEAFPGQDFQGILTRIAPPADPNNRVFEVECTIPNPGNRLFTSLSIL